MVEWLPKTFICFFLKNSSKYDNIISHLHDHNNFVVHYRNLKFVKELGVKIKLHKVISFDQKPWLKSSIDFYTDCRKQAKDDFENYFLKKK
jgi:hypothetical protein